MSQPHSGTCSCGDFRELDESPECFDCNSLTKKCSVMPELYVCPRCDEAPDTERSPVSEPPVDEAQQEIERLRARLSVLSDQVLDAEKNARHCVECMVQAESVADEANLALLSANVLLKRLSDAPLTGSNAWLATLRVAARAFLKTQGVDANDPPMPTNTEF